MVVSRILLQPWPEAITPIASDPACAVFRHAPSGESKMNMKLMTVGESADNDLGIFGGLSDEGDGVFKIGEMSKTYGVTLRTLRFYEDKGLLSPAREGSTRLYSRRDRTRLKLILLGRKVGFSLRDVKQMMDLYDPAGSNAKQLRLTLDKSEKQLGRLHKQQQAIEEAIGELSALMNVVRKKLAERPVVASSSSSS
jgi:DNA-binding transcriptional MerR regulator